MYYIYFCLNGRKNKYVDKLEVDKYTFDNAVDIWPFDVIDVVEDDDRHIYKLWFDYGDE